MITNRLEASLTKPQEVPWRQSRVPLRFAQPVARFPHTPQDILGNWSLGLCWKKGMRARFGRLTWDTG